MTKTTTEKTNRNHIRLDKNGIYIQGGYRTLLTSSLFYFRIPRERWEDRMLLLKAAGYNAVDVYFPWNYHETSPGEWDFSGERDVTAFLKLAQKHELFVIARPGPYICSEWDGGALPAWLAAEQVAVRQDDPEFLSRIGNWYEHILPLLAPWQITQKGTVICMQIENELDFFDCKSPVSYMEKLMIMAARLGIDVPLFYCCGQNDLLRGGGLTPGLHTAFNVYTSADNTGLEERVLHLYQAAADRQMPLLITETNREHSYLKRLLACGARLLSPYNQTAGSTLRWYNGITNWGTADSPIALMATDYDFISMIGSAGEVNAQFYEARLLAGLLHSLGEDLACAVPAVSEDFFLNSRGPVNEKLPLLQTRRGGLLAVSNLGGETDMELIGKDAVFSLHMPSLYTKLLPVNLSLTDDGKTVLLGSSYEIAYIHTEEALHPDNSSNTDGASHPAHSRILVGMYGEGPFTARLETDGEISAITLPPGRQQHTFTCKEVTFIVGSPEVMALSAIPGLPPVSGNPDTQSSDCSVDSMQAEPCELPGGKAKAVPVLPMEKLGQYRGLGRYSFSLNRESRILFQEAADFLTLKRDGQTLETCYGRGHHLERELEAGEYDLYTEIWGHSNFNDIRCRSLHMGSLKGISGIHAITASRDISENWMFDLDEQPSSEWYFFRHSNYNTISAVDGYNRASMPLYTVYDKWVELPEDAESLFLHFTKADCIISVYVNGRYLCDVLPDDPYVDISAYAGNHRIEICLRILRQFYTDEAGQVLLLSGKQIKECRYASIPVEEITFSGAGSTLSLPAAFTPGRDMLLSPSLPMGDGRDIKLFFQGQDVKLTILHHRTVIGRLLLPSAQYPTVAGGSRNVVHLCREWLEEGPPVIWCQPVGPNPCISGLEIRYYRSVLDVR